MITILYLTGAIALFIDLITRETPKGTTLSEHAFVALVCSAIWPAFMLSKIFGRL